MKKLILLILILLIPAISQSADITSAQDGNWADEATWTGGTVPGDGDTATISHNVTVTDNRTVGSLATGTYSLVVQSSKTLTINADITLTVKGETNFNAATLTMNEGSTFLVDGGNFKINYYNAFTANINGTESNRCTFGADTGNYTYVDMQSTSFSNMNWNSSYCDFINLGYSGSVIGIEIYSLSATRHFLADHCLFKNCSNITIHGSTHSGSRVEFTNCDFRGSPDTYFLTNSAGSFTYGNRKISNCTFDSSSSGKVVRLRVDNSTKFIVNDCRFNNTSLWAHEGAEIYNNIILNGSIPLDYANPSVYIYNNFLWGNSNNWHAIYSSANAHTGKVYIHDNVLVNDSTYSTDTGNFFLYGEAGSNARWELKNNITFGHNFAIGRGSTFTNLFLADHNTHIISSNSCSDTFALIEVADIGTTANVILKNNIYYNEFSVGTYHNNFTYNMQDSNALMDYLDYNTIYGPTWASRYNPDPAIPDMVLGQDGYGLHDLNADPMFKNPDATLATYSTYMGGAGTSADAIIKIMSFTGYAQDGTATTATTNYTLDSLLNYFKSAATPTNAQLITAGADGYAGALPVSTTNILNNGVFNNFYVSGTF